MSKYKGKELELVSGEKGKKIAIIKSRAYWKDVQLKTILLILIETFIVAVGSFYD